MGASLSLSRRFQRKLPRVAKTGGQWLRAIVAGQCPRTRLVFVVGSQRSGTRLPLQVMDYSPNIATFSEGSAPYFRGVLLQPLSRVEQLLNRSPSPIIALKPICETHRINELLDRFPGSKAIWIFRNYQSAVNSASIKWKSGREAVRRLAAGETKSAGWRIGGLSDQKLALVRRLYRPDMSLHEANAVMWYLRNGLFFDLAASSRCDVLLVHYEDFVANPTARFARMFEFIGTSIPPGFANAVRPSRHSKPRFPNISPEIRLLCDELQDRLVAHYGVQDTVRPGIAGASA